MATQSTSSSVQPRVQATVPVIISQILSCKQPQFRIFDVPIQVLSLVGVIRNISIASCQVSCEIQDHSGKIKALIRLEAESEATVKLTGIAQDNYAQIFGTVRIENGEKVVLILKMFPVNDLNMITHHLLQSICFTLEAEATFNKQLASANTSAAAFADSLNEENGDETPSTSTTPHFTDFQRLVFDIVKSEFSDFGITKGNILRQFPSYQGHEVNQALDYLINHGIIYHSIDQEHLKATGHY